MEELYLNISQLLLDRFPNETLFRQQLHSSIQLGSDCHAIDNSNNPFLYKNDSGSNILHIACTNIMNVPLSIFASILSIYPQLASEKNNFNITPLHKAVVSAKTFDIEKLKLIINRNQDSLRTADISGQTPLHCLISMKNYPSLDVLQLLIELCPEALMLTDKSGQLPLHKASRKTKIDGIIVEELMRAYPHGLAHKDNYGCLPLHLAVCRDTWNEEVIRALVEAYPEGVIERDQQGFLPYDRLIQRRHTSGISNTDEIGRLFLTLNNTIIEEQNQNSLTNNLIKKGDGRKSRSNQNSRKTRMAQRNVMSQSPTQSQNTAGNVSRDNSFSPTSSRGPSPISSPKKSMGN